MPNPVQPQDSSMSRRGLLIGAAVATAAVGIGALVLPKILDRFTPITLDVDKGELTEAALNDNMHRRIILSGHFEFVEEAKRSLWIQSSAHRSTEILPPGSYFAQGPFQIYQAKLSSVKLELLFGTKLDRTDAVLKISGEIKKDQAGTFVMDNARLES